jgi:hypothetical protein
MGKEKASHPEYYMNPAEIASEKEEKSNRMSFIERNPDLNIQDILDNTYYPAEIKENLRTSFFVSAEDEVAGLEQDYEERQIVKKSKKYDDYSSDSSDEIQNTKSKRRRKKHDSDYDDDWYEKQGHKLISQDGKVVKNRGRPPKSQSSANYNNNNNKTTPTKGRKPTLKVEKTYEIDNVPSTLSAPAQCTPLKKNSDTTVIDKGVKPLGDMKNVKCEMINSLF